MNTFFEVSFLAPLTLKRQTCNDPSSEFPPLLHPLLLRQNGYIKNETDKECNDFELSNETASRLCSSCHLKKEVNEFYKAKDKLRTACKECTKESERRRYNLRKHPYK